MEAASSGRRVDLPGRGATWVHEVAGPPGAPVLLLLHGLAATALLNWATSLTTLGRGFRVIALDQRGHGHGIRRIGAFKLEDCADDAAALADRFGLERVIPVGYSMGGAVAQLFWRRHPNGPRVSCSAPPVRVSAVRGLSGRPPRSGRCCRWRRARHPGRCGTEWASACSRTFRIPPCSRH